MIMTGYMPAFTLGLFLLSRRGISNTLALIYNNYIKKIKEKIINKNEKFKCEKFTWVN
jgi:hypothetical protein